MQGYFYCLTCNKKRFFVRGLCEVCNRPYKDLEEDIDITHIGEYIYNCAVNFNPEFPICRGSVVSRPCKYARECFEYHGLNFEDFKKYYEKKEVEDERK